MRTNLPVTQREFDYPADATLMSSTDTHSRILYANEAFIQVSGFTREELMGQPHNMVRHPDMPREAFADMWATLKQGESWTALVKNRCKNGDHYWVRANATPVVRGGQVQGYMSVRTRPSREEVQSAEQLYQRFREGRAGSLAFHKGLVVHQGLGRWRSVFQLMSLRWRLAMGPLLITAFSIACGLLAGLNHAQLAWLVAADVVAAGLGMWWLNAQIARPLEQIHKQAAAVASGQPGENMNLNRVDTIGMILRAVNQSGLNLRSLIDDVSSQVHGLRDAAQEIAQGNHDLHGRTDATAAQLQQTAASMTQMTSTVRANTQTALDANSFASEASGAAQHGGEVVGKVVHTMRDITDSSRKIADIISVIDGIAFQTNILALNAAVEAARAGEQGRGFAVVADEVRTLASRTQKSTEEIQKTIEQLQSAARSAVQKMQQSTVQAEQSVSSANQAGESLQVITTSIRRIREMNQHSASATEEQQSMANTIVNHVVDIVKHTEHSSQSAGNIAKASRELANLAQNLENITRLFRV